MPMCLLNPGCGTAEMAGTCLGNTPAAVVSLGKRISSGVATRSAAREGRGQGWHAAEGQRSRVPPLAQAYLTSRPGRYWSVGQMTVPGACFELKVLLAYCCPSCAVPRVAYVGCFAEPDCGANRALALVAREDAMTMERCAYLAAAKGFTYFGLQWYKECWAGNDISRYTQQGTCNTPCGGNSQQTCGGSCANSLHTLAGEAELWAHWHVPSRPWVWYS